MLIRRFKDPSPAVRYWAATGCVVLGAEARPARGPLLALLEDPSVSVRIAAVEALYRLEKPAAVGNTPEKSLETLLKTLESALKGDNRSEERSVGKWCVRTCRSRWSTYRKKKK